MCIKAYRKHFWFACMLKQTVKCSEWVNLLSFVVLCVCFLSFVMFYAQVFAFLVLHVASQTPWGQNVKVDTGWTYNSAGSMCKYNSNNNNRFSLWQLHKSSVEQVIVRTDFNKMTVPQRRGEHHQPVHILSHHIPMFCHAPPGLKQTHKAPLGVCKKPAERLFNMF